MNANDILLAVNAGEDKDWEFKSAKGGIPGNLWQTYSAMANTDGGVIVLGVQEAEGDFEVHGLVNPAKIEQEFWSNVNNRGKVSLNLLTNNDVRTLPVIGKTVLAVHVPRASRRQRPVFVGQNPLDGTYRRYSDGDYLCSRDEVGRMLADQAEQPADCEILPNFSLDDLDKRSLVQYRNRFASRSPAHPWLKLSARSLLERLGAWRRDRNTREEGLTVAGILMFGKYEAICDPSAVPQYNVDYREELSDDPRSRWTDRIWPDGTWEANLFQFFERSYPRLVGDLKIPFQFATLRPGEAPSPQRQLFQRHDETIVHEAVREALVNSLVHADFRGQGGTVIQRFRDRLVFSNPGTLLLGIEQILSGGVSECRNKTLQSMFAMLGYGERAGSGIDKIRQGWASQQWRWPMIKEQHRPDRVVLVLPMVSLLPEDSLDRIRESLGGDLTRLNGREVQALVTADMEGYVTNQRLQQFCDDHTSDITRLLQDLVAKGLLLKDGYGRWASYRLSDKFEGSRRSGQRTPDITPEDSGYSEASPVITARNSDLAPEEDPALIAIAEPARKKKRLDPEEMKGLIRTLCQGRFLTLRQLANLLDREPTGLQRWILRPMAHEKQLVLAFPETVNHPKQAYKTNPDWNIT